MLFRDNQLEWKVPMPTLMRTRHLQVFLAVAKAESMQRAAAEVHLTQPAISKLIGELEEIFGTRLFVRSRQGVALTEGGRALAARAGHILNDIENARDEVFAIASGALGCVRIGVLPVVEARLLPATLLALRRSAPGLAAEIEEGTRAVLMNALRRGEIDCVIGRLDPGEQDRTLRVEKLVQLPIKIVANPRHPLSGRRRLSWADLAAYPWILPKAGAPIRTVIDREFADAGVVPPLPMISSTSIRLNLAVLCGTDMIGVMSQDAALAYSRAGELAILPIELTGSLPHVGVVTRSSHVSHALRTFLAELRAQCQADAMSVDLN